MFKKTTLALLLLLFASNLYSQERKQITHQNQTWYGYFMTFKITNKLSFLHDFEERHFNKPFSQNLAVFSPHIHYKFAKNWDVGFGLEFILETIASPEETELMMPKELYNHSAYEFNPYLIFSQSNTFNGVSVSHRFRNELLLLGSRDPETNKLTNLEYSRIRFRYRLQVVVPIVKFNNETQRFFYIINNEILINCFQPKIISVFNQNRFYTGFGVDLIPNLTLDMGYMNWFAQSNNATSFTMRHIFRFNISHTFDCRKNQEPPTL